MYRNLGQSDFGHGAFGPDFVDLGMKDQSVLRTLRRRHQKIDTIWLYNFARGRKRHSLEADRAIEADADITSIGWEAEQGPRSSSLSSWREEY